MCVSGDPSTLNHVLKLLLRILPDLIASRQQWLIQLHDSKNSGHNYKEIFWLISRLIDKYEPVHDRDDPIDIEDATRHVAHSISVYTEKGAGQNGSGGPDYCLIGLLQVCTALLRHEPGFKYSSDGLILLKNVFYDCLFLIPSSPYEADTVKPKCETKSARLTAYELLLELVNGSERNYKELQALFFRHHSADPKTGTHSSYGWNYWPHELERSAVGYVGLINLGATCYMASCVQQMFMIPKARAAILQSKEPEDPKFLPIHKELLKMFTYLQVQFSLIFICV